MVHKRTYATGKTSWYYCFDLPGSTREHRKQVKVCGFETKKAAIEAETARRVDEAKKAEVLAKGATTLPKTLADLFAEFLREHAEKKLAPKTVERYREQAAYLSPDLLAMPITEITPLHLGREWNRLLKEGGRVRKTKAARPLSAKTVRNIAGVVSSAFARAIRWGLIESNPATASEPPIARKHEGIALSPAQQALLLEAAGSPLAEFLELCAATGARRGEILALRWSDIADGRATIARSLSQTKAGLTYKAPKGGKARAVTLPASMAVVLERHRQAQQIMREAFGSDYRSDLDLIFCDLDGSELKPDSVSSAVSLLFRRLKLPAGASLHTLRHTHGSHLLAAGMELTAVSARLGHSSTYVTATVYSHAVHGRDDEAARVWDAFQRKGSDAGEKLVRTGEDLKAVTQ